MSGDLVMYRRGEAQRFGICAAAVLERIRWRCGQAGADRTVIDGHRYWKVSLQALGEEIGLDRRAVRAALDRLGDAVVANSAAGKIGAYRPSTESDTRLPDVAENGTVPGRNLTSTRTESDNAPYTETLETRRDGAREPNGTDVHPGATASTSATANGTAEQLAIQVEPSRYCDTHMPDGTDDPCSACGRRREVHDRWEAARADAARRARPPRPTWECGMCRDTEVLQTNDGLLAAGPMRCFHHIGPGGRRLMTAAEQAEFAPTIERLRRATKMASDKGLA